MKALRFGVGRKDGPRSMSYNLIVRKSDIYIICRNGSGQVKVSLHESGQGQFSRTDEWVKTNGATNQSRHIDRWTFDSRTGDSSPTLLFRIVIPQSELKFRGAILKPTYLMDFPAHESRENQVLCVTLNLFLTPVAAGIDGPEGFVRFPPLRLNNGRWCVLLGQYHFHKVDEIESLRQQSILAALRSDATFMLTDEWTGNAFFNPSENSRGFVEIALKPYAH